MDRDESGVLLRALPAYRRLCVAALLAFGFALLVIGWACAFKGCAS